MLKINTCFFWGKKQSTLGLMKQHSSSGFIKYYGLVYVIRHTQKSSKKSQWWQEIARNPGIFSNIPDGSLSIRKRQIRSREIQTSIPGLKSGFGSKWIKTASDFNNKNRNPSLSIFNAPGVHTNFPKWERVIAGQEILTRGRQKCKLTSDSIFYLGRASSAVLFLTKDWCGLL